MLKYIIHIKSEIKCRCECKNSIKHLVYKKNYVWNLSSCACEINRYSKNFAYMESIDEVSIIKCYEIIVQQEMFE